MTPAGRSSCVGEMRWRRRRQEYKDGRSIWMFRPIGSICVWFANAVFARLGFLPVSFLDLLNLVTSEAAGCLHLRPHRGIGAAQKRVRVT
jgi:hypothetical protein